MYIKIINKNKINDGKRFINKIIVAYVISILTIGTVLPIVHSDSVSFYCLSSQEQAPLAVNHSPVFGTPAPVNGSTNNPINLAWSIPINDSEGDLFSWIIQCSDGGFHGGNFAENGTKTLYPSHLAYATTYKIWVNATDPTGSGNFTRRWYTFTTQTNLTNNPPMFGTPSPANGSTGNLLSLSWRIPINDSEGDTFSWTIQCSNGQANNGTGATNGTKSLALSGLTNSTSYKIWVNATDPTGSGLYTRKWYTFTTLANQPPDLPIITGPASGKAGVSYVYTFVTVDSNGDDVYYRIEWGDGSPVTEWIGPFHSSQAVMVSHTYSNIGTLIIKCQAKDSNDLYSNWGQLVVTMPKASISSLFLELIERLFELFPNAFPLLQQLMGY